MGAVSGTAGVPDNVPSVPEELAIDARGLRKAYGKVQALDGVDLAVPAGTVLGLLGPNGAGKTTTVRVLTTLLKPDEGTAHVAGIDVVKDADRVREHIGLAGQYAAVDENLTGVENLELVGRLYHLGRTKARARTKELLERFDLEEAGGRAAKTYSGGMRRRLDLAAALVVSPPVLFLDEPTTGLDPRSRLSVWDLVEGLVDDGTTVLLTTQYLDEVDRLADRIVVIDHGKVIAEGTADELKDQVGGERLVVVLEDDATAARAADVLRGLANASAAPVVDGAEVAVTLRTRTGVLAEAVRALDGVGIEAGDLSIRRPTLDDVFLGLTGHAAEDPTDDDSQGDRA